MNNEVMKQAILANPTPELIKAYEEMTGEKLEVTLQEAPGSGTIEGTTSRKKKAAPKVSKKKKVLPEKRTKPQRRIITDDDDDDIEDDDGGEDEFSTRLANKRKPARSRVGEGRVMAKATEFTAPTKIQFVDDRNEAVEDREFDQKHPCPRTPRTRATFEYVKVQCRKCGQRDYVAPIFVPRNVKRYMCNECSVSGG